MKRNRIHQWIGVSIMVLSLLFLFGAPVGAQVNADAGIAIDMDITTRNYDSAGTDIESALSVTTTNKFFVGLVALDVENVRGVEFKITFDPERIQIQPGDFTTDNAMAGITNLLAENGGTVMGVAGFLPGVDNEIQITVGIAGDDDSQRVSGTGLIGILAITPLDTDANNELNISYAKITEVTGSVYNELPTTKLEEGSAVVNPVACDAVASFTITENNNRVVAIDMSGSTTPGGFVINWGDTTVEENPATLSHTYDADGDYNITLTARGTGGTCTEEYTLPVSVVASTCSIVLTATNQTIGGTPVTASSITVTQGDIVLFDATGSTGATAYQWLLDAGSAGTDATYTLDTSSLSVSTHHVQLNMTCASGTDTAYMDVIVETHPTECQAIITGPDTAVAPSTVKLYADSSVVAVGDSIISYAWAITDPDGNSAGTVGGNPGNINISSIRVPDDVYSVVLTITTANGCSDESEAHVITVVEDLPTCDGISAVISATPATANTYQQIVFSGSASTPSDDATAITNYHWNFGDNSQDDAEQSTKEYIAAGDYTVTLTVTDDNDCTATDTITMTITPPGGLLGDADDNGVVDIFDALLVAQYDADIILASQVPGFDVSDVDNNGEVDINDALGIAQYDAGLPCGCLLD